MYDAREKALRDKQWELTASRNEGKIEAKVAHIRMLQSILQIDVSSEAELKAAEMSQLDSLIDDLQAQIRNRLSS